MKSLKSMPKKIHFWVLWDLVPSLPSLILLKFAWPVVKRLFLLVAKQSLGQPPSRHEKRPKNWRHNLNIVSKHQLPFAISQFSLLGISCNIQSLCGVTKSVRQISSNRKYKPSYMPAVWHEQTAWLCLTGMAQPFTDKLAQPLLSPCHPVSPSKIRLDATNPSTQVILGFRNCPWLNIKKVACVQDICHLPKKSVLHQAHWPPAYFHTAVPTVLALVSLACQNWDQFY